MSQSHLTKPACNPETSTPASAPAAATAPVSSTMAPPVATNEPSSLLSAIARILLLRRTAGRTEPVAPSLPHNDNASPDAECPDVEWAMQMMN